MSLVLIEGMTLLSYLRFELMLFSKYETFQVILIKSPLLIQRPYDYLYMRLVVDELY